jgi:hypothetical protein
VWGDSTGRRQVAVSPTVTMKGGEYFYLPSLSFLRSLASSRTSPGTPPRE